MVCWKLRCNWISVSWEMDCWYFLHLNLKVQLVPYSYARGLQKSIKTQTEMKWSYCWCLAKSSWQPSCPMSMYMCIHRSTIRIFCFHATFRRFPLAWTAGSAEKHGFLRYWEWVMAEGWSPSRTLLPPH